MDKILLGQSKTINVRKVLEINLKPGRLFFPYILLESFENFLPNPYYEPLSWFVIIKPPQSENKVQPISVYHHSLTDSLSMAEYLQQNSKCYDYTSCDTCMQKDQHPA